MLGSLVKEWQNSCVLGSSHDIDDGLREKSGDERQRDWEKGDDGAVRIRDGYEIDR